MIYLQFAVREHGRKFAYCMPQTDVNKGAKYAKMIQKESCCVLDEGIYLRRHGFDSLLWSNALAGSILCLTLGKQAELESG